MLSCVRLFATLWTVAHQAPLCMEFWEAKYWSGLPFPSPIFNQPSLFFLKSIDIIAVSQDTNHPTMAFRGPGFLEYVFLSIRLSPLTRVYVSQFDSLG